MEVQELRLYNLLQYENDVVPVVGLDLEKDKNLSLVQIRQGDSKIPIHSQQLKPIRLTSEWLPDLVSRKVIVQIPGYDTTSPTLESMILTFRKIRF
ncbi:hypothetical protein [Epilithonimonas sp.]|uniref:hypothetical protein n=1 Tax=Epilithonimonas sp. TaxID=2894511 RepID=UPI0028990E17|nr:hypothetical protein [Epilithonimonas sp.]